jgi:hypothetical protein
MFKSETDRIPVLGKTIAALPVRELKRQRTAVSWRRPPKLYLLLGLIRMWRKVSCILCHSIAGAYE